jgi:hypothetical protein
MLLVEAADLVGHAVASAADHVQAGLQLADHHDSRGRDAEPILVE